jgi:hypothetical protein
VIVITSNLPPIDLLGHIHDGFYLHLTHLRGLSKFTLIEGLSDAKNNLEACIDRGACLSSYQIRSFMEESTTLGMT